MESTSQAPLPQEDAMDECSQQTDERPVEPETQDVSAEADAPVTPEAICIRRQSLASEHTAFMRWVAEELTPEAVPHSVEICGRPVELGTWERATLRSVPLPWDGEPGRALELLAEGVAVHVKFSELRDCFDHGPLPPPSELPAFLDSIVTAVAVGIALQNELQWDIDRMIGSGQLADAKSLSAFRVRVVNDVSDVKDRIGAAELEEAERRAELLITVQPGVEQEGSQRPLLAEKDPDAPSWATYGGSEPSPGLPPWLSEEPQEEGPERTARSTKVRNSFKPLLWVLAGLIMVYGVVILPRMGQPSKVPVLTTEHFSHFESVRRVVARPPSLFVVMDAAGWQGGTEEQRLQILEDMGRVAGAAGYSGIHVRTSDGLPAGEWMSKTGVRLTRRTANPT